MFVAVKRAAVSCGSESRSKEVNMKVNYRGFEIDAHRDKSLTGIELIFYSIFRIKDQQEFASGFSYSGETIRGFIKDMKGQVDDLFENPEEYDFEF